MYAKDLMIRKKIIEYKSVRVKQIQIFSDLKRKMIPILYKIYFLNCNRYWEVKYQEMFQITFKKNLQAGCAGNGTLE